MSSNKLDSKENTFAEGETHFGYQTVPEAEKADRVKAVFNNVATSYDVMNDVMSAGVHRLWKDSMIDSLNPRADMTLLDVAGGTGDIAFRFLEASKNSNVTVCDINAEMLKVGEARAAQKKYGERINFVCGDAMALPMPDKSVDAYTIAFGIRNVTRVEEALSEAFRVLKRGGRFLCLEFSPEVAPGLQNIYENYSFHVIPKMGEIIANDRESYQYLVESIRRFPAPKKFASMIEQAGFSKVTFRTMSGGVVALHSGYKV